MARIDLEIPLSDLALDLAYEEGLARSEAERLAPVILAQVREAWVAHGLVGIARAGDWSLARGEGQVFLETRVWGFEGDTASRVRVG